MEKLRKRYEDYVEQAIVIRKKAGPLAGIFGLSNGPQDDPAHVIFYEDVQKWVADFMKTDPDGAASFEAARFLICASAEMGQADSYWMMYAAQGIDFVKLAVAFLRRVKYNRLVFLFSSILR